MTMSLCVGTGEARDSSIRAQCVIGASAIAGSTIAQGWRYSCEWVSSFVALKRLFGFSRLVEIGAPLVTARLLRSSDPVVSTRKEPATCSGGIPSDAPVHTP